MKQDEMIVMLRRVIKENQNYTTWTVSTPHLMQLVNNAIELEREACAKVCEEQMQGKSIWVEGAIACKAAIRARGQE
jgi:hypothetical protein